MHLISVNCKHVNITDIRIALKQWPFSVHNINNILMIFEDADYYFLSESILGYATLAAHAPFPEDTNTTWTTSEIYLEHLKEENSLQVPKRYENMLCIYEK